MLPLFLNVGDVDLQESRKKIDKLGEESVNSCSPKLLSAAVVGAEQEVMLKQSVLK